MTVRRIQQRRTKGWRKPEGAISCARPSKLGNPFEVGAEVTVDTMRDIAMITMTPDMAVACYRSLWVTRLLRDPEDHPDDAAWVQGWYDELDRVRGHDLMCFCPLTQPCHVDVVLELANPGWKRPVVGGLIDRAHRTLGTPGPGFDGGPPAGGLGLSSLIPNGLGTLNLFGGAARNAEGTIPMWTIYDHPSDYPTAFVVREWIVVPGNPNPVAGDATAHDTLDAARAAIPEGTVRIPSAAADDQNIVETWI